MNAYRLLVTALLLTTAACAAPEEDSSDGSNEALATTPRAAASEDAAKTFQQFTDALNKAQPSDFKQEIGGSAKNYIASVVTHVKSSDDPKASWFSFQMPNDKLDRWYLVEIHSSSSPQQVFFVYQGVFDQGLGAGILRAEYSPKPYARCSAPTTNDPVKCDLVSDSVRIYEPTDVYISKPPGSH